MKPLLVTGAAGLLGGRLAELLAGEFAVVAGVHQSRPPAHLPQVRVDLKAPATVEAAFETARPEAVVHAAALADANRCEEDPEAARAINVHGTALVAQACARFGVRLIVLSTDLVFAGTKGGVAESDPPGPMMVYGHTKLEAEDEALGLCAGSAVVRVALVCGRGYGHRPTASEAVTWALRRGQRPRLFTDQFRTPVDAEAVALALAGLVRGLGEGRYHLGGAERVSRSELGARTATAFGLDPAGVEAITQAAFAQPAPRPRDVSLDSSRARGELGYAPRPLDDMIKSGRPESPPV